VDSHELIVRLPLQRTVQFGDVRIGMVHDAGPAKGRLERMRRRFPDVDAVVFGHSHIPLHERDASGFQLFNPGSPTDRRRQPRHTLGLAHIDGRTLTFELIALD
jgi:predicted phosphodiesterase